MRLPVLQMLFYIMSIHIVIDGYNLIRQSRSFSDLDRQDLQMGREALVDALAAYKRVKPYAITVVFDGGDASGGMPRRDRLKGIELRYSNPGELADTVQSAQSIAYGDLPERSLREMVERYPNLDVIHDFTFLDTGRIAGVDANRFC